MSADLTERADRLLGYGGFHRMAWARFYGEDDGAFPRFAERADGYELIDVQGRSFVDWTNGGGPVILGYNHPAVEEAVRAQLAHKAGPTLTLMHPVELEVASKLTEMVPCAEMVAFGKNGSDAVTAAVRIARAATRREVILHHGGHGFHDWFVSSLGAAGVPKSIGSLVHSFPYNDVAALEELFDRLDGQVAAIVMEPVNIVMPETGYLESVRELAHGRGALLIFDEMVTAFRLAPGGAQELFGVTPDLAALGKGIANGMPLSAVVGRREYMRHLPHVAYGMTFRGETLSLAVARAVLGVIRAQPVAEHLAAVGTAVREGFERACATHGVIAQLNGPPARMSFAFGDDAAVPPERLETVFLRECARNGVLTNGNILPSFAHDQEAIDRTMSAFDEALEATVELLRAGRAAMLEAIRSGVADEDGPGGYLDAAREEGGRLLVRGWLLPKNRAPDAVEFVSSDGRQLLADPVKRPDVAQAFPSADGAEDCGFAAALPAEMFARGDDYDFTLRAREGDEVVFACRILRPQDGQRAVTVRTGRFENRTLHI